MKKLIETLVVTVAVTLIVTLALLLNFNSYAAEAPAMPPAQVTVIQAEERLLSPTDTVSGAIVSHSNARISAQVTGEILWLGDIGRFFKKGESIAKLRSDKFTYAVNAAEATLKGFQADLAFADSEVKRFSALSKKDNTSKARLQEAIARSNRLKQDVANAQATLAMAKFDLQQTNIKAPFDGHLIQTFSSEGEFVNLGTAVAQFVDTARIEVSANIPLTSLPYIKAEQKLEVTNGSLTQFFPIIAIAPVADEQSRLISLRLKVTDQQWKIGMPAKIKVPSAHAQKRVVVPRDTLIIKSGEVYLFKINDNMQAEKVVADILAIDEHWVAIRHKLNIGDNIVIRGGERLMPGQTVSILK